MDPTRCEPRLDEDPSDGQKLSLVENDAAANPLLLLSRTDCSSDAITPPFDPFAVEADAAGDADGVPFASSKRLQVLVVDDDGVFAHTCARLLEAAGHGVEIASDGKTAVKLARNKEFDLVVADVNLPDKSGLQVLRDIRLRNADLPIVLVTGNPELDTARAALEEGALSYLLKPVSAMQMESVIERAIRARKTSQRLHVAHQHDETLRLTQERFSRALSGLWMAFQPIVSWSAKSIIGYEALVRTNEPSLSSPLDLLKAAEDLKQIGLLGQRVRRHVASVMTGCSHPSTMFINLHSLELLDESLYDPAAPLAAFAEQVYFEITERTAVDDTPDFLARTRRLRSLGYKIAVSDVAGGLSGLGSLALLEPDAVKLEMSLFREIESVAVKRKLMRAVVTLCQELDVPLIAEGVETEAERDDFAAKHGDLMQGYLFARPDFPLPQPRF